jgi:hypothetical protein
MQSTERVWLEDDALVIRRDVDVTPVLDHAANLRSVGATGSADFKHAACYEPEVVYAWCQRHGITYGEWMANPVHVKAMLNDPDMAAFRIWKGRA